MPTYTVNRGKYHTVARCYECGWYEDDYLTAERRAINHCTETGHPVNLEIGERMSRTTVEDTLKS